jgi:predicted ATPase
MTSLEKRLARLSGRMRRDAWLMVQEVRQHPKFLELLADLEKVDGSLDVSDIQRALKRFLAHRQKKK